VRRRLLVALTACAAMVLSSLGDPSLEPAGAPAPGTDEYDVKAAFLVHFSRLYVEWPKSSFEDGTSPVVVGVVGKDPFGKRLEKAFRGKTAGKRKIVLRRYAELDDVRPCHLLFVPHGERRHIGELVERLGTEGVLYVSESKGLARKGSVINFYLERKKVRFEVNTDAAKRGKLRISSSLLKLARIVKDEEQS
jgi:hypothetical protein